MQHDNILKKLNFNQTRDQGQGQSDHKMVYDTPPYQDASTHQTWNFYLNQNRKYALDMIILEMRSGEGYNDLKMVLNTPQFKDASTH